MGPRTVEHLAEDVGALELDLDDQQYGRPDEISAVSLGTPHEHVAAALDHGSDGNRAVLRSHVVPVT